MSSDSENKAERERELADYDDMIEFFREENYDFSVGGRNDYVGVTQNRTGNVDIAVGTGMNYLAGSNLTREEAIALAEGILKLVK